MNVSDICRIKYRFLFGVLTFLFMLVLLTCTNKNPVDPTETSQDNLYILTNISASVEKIFKGDSVSIRVQLLDTDEKPVQEHQVKFSTDIGSVKPSQNMTDENGWARSRFYSEDDLGKATITVTSKDAISSSLEIDILSYEESSLFINTARKKILANGIDTTLINIKIQGDSVDYEGKVVSLNAESGEITPPTITLNSENKATAILTSIGSKQDTISTISAEMSTEEGITAVPIKITFTGINLTVNANPVVIMADGKSTSNISVIIKETSTDFALYGQVVEFSASDGLIPRSATTDDKGLAQAPLTSSVDSALSKVTVYYGTLEDSIHVEFRKSTPSNVEVSAIPSVIIADGESQSQIRVNVTDENNNPAPDGTPVDFEITDGSGSIEQYKVTGNGVATSYLTSSTKPDTAHIRIIVTISETSVLRDSINVVYIAGDPDKILVKTNKDTVKANGIDTTHVQAKVMDAQGTPLKNVTVNFSASIGDITSNATTNSSGIANAVFSSGEVGYSTITARAEGFSVSGKTTIALIPGPPNSILLNFDPPVIGVRETGQNQTTLIEADVRDTKNNPVVDGTNVIFRIVHGPGGGETLSSQDSIPTVDGKARISLSSGTVSGVVRVEAKAVGQEGNIISESSEIMIQAGPPHMKDRNDFSTTHMTIAAEVLNIWKIHGETTLTISVFDKYHNPVPEGTAIYLTASGGGVETKTAYTNEKGIANVILHAGNPQPIVNNYYHDKLMHNPNIPSKPLPGIVYYPDIGDTLLPNFEGWNYNSIYDPPVYVDSLDIRDPSDDLEDGSDIWDLTLNSLEYSNFDTVGRYHNSNLEVYHGLENDGIARVIARTEGRDAQGDSILVWDQIAVVYSGAVGYKDNSYYSLGNDTLHMGEYTTMIFSLMDSNGNPIQSLSDITARLTNDVDARLSWESFETSAGTGHVYYSITIANSIEDPTEDNDEGYTSIEITWESKDKHQMGTVVSAYGVFIAI